MAWQPGMPINPAAGRGVTQTTGRGVGLPLPRGIILFYHDFTFYVNIYKGPFVRPGAGFVSLPPDNYVCHRCGQPGHWINHCPTNGDAKYDQVRITSILKTFFHNQFFT